MIILKRIHLENFMSITNLDLEFNEVQTTAITGQNGQGKSSLFDATAFALTGYRKGESYKNYVKTGSEKAVISLDALLNDEPVSYYIEIYNGNSKYHSLQPVSRKVTFRGKEYLNSEFSQFLETYEMTDLESLMFRHQGSNDLIDSRPKERAAMLKKLFKFEFPETVEYLKTKMEENKQANIEYNALVEELQNRTFNTLPLLREAPQENINKLEDELGELDATLSKIGNANDEELRRCEEDINSLQRTIKSVEANMKNDTETCEALKRSIANILKNIEGVTIGNLQQELDKLREELSGHELEYAQKREKDAQLHADYRVIEYTLKETESQYKISQTGVCHACGQPIEESHIINLKNLLEQKKNELEVKKQEIIDLNFDKNDTDGKKLREKIRTLQSRIDNHAELLSKKERDETRLKDLTRLIEERQGTLNELNSKMSLLIEKKDNLAEMSKLVELRNSLLNERKEKANLIQSYKETKIRNTERRKTNETILKEAAERDTRVKELIERLNEVTIKISRIKQEIEIFESKFPNYIVLQACKHLEDVINDIVQRVFPYCKVALEMDKSGVNFVYTSESSNDEWIPVKMSSGAERTVLGLAYFVALARLSNISCIFLDEIDASCSPENSGILYDFIAELNIFPQVFFISHRPEAHEAVKAKNDSLVTYLVEKGEYMEI